MTETAFTLGKYAAHVVPGLPALLPVVARPELDVVARLLGPAGLLAYLVADGRRSPAGTPTRGEV